MRSERQLRSLIFIVLLCAGCAAPKPFRAIPASERQGAQVVNATRPPSPEYSTANSQALRSAGSESGVIPAVILEASAESIEAKGSRWVAEIRAKSGIH